MTLRLNALLTYQLPKPPVDDEACFVARRYTDVVEPEVFTPATRKFFNANPASFDWVNQQTQGLPDYLIKYFASRYEQLCQKRSAREANLFILKKMMPAARRTFKVLEQYQNLPNSQKVASIKARLDSLQDEEKYSFNQSDVPEDEPQYSFNFEAIERRNKKQSPLRKRILAEMELNELKDMAYVLAKSINQYFIDVSGRTELQANIEVTPEMVERYEAIAIILTYEDVAKMVRQFGIKPPRKYKKQTELAALQDISRMISDKWWLNRLKRIRKIMREHLAIAMGQVSGRASPYASWDCIKEYQEQQKINWDFIQNSILFDVETEEEADLKDMVLKSVSNPAIRRHELAARARGCTDIGIELGLRALFVTLTTPSSYHNSYKKGGFIPHWNGSNPKQSQDYLNNVWQRIRAKLSREDIRWFGLRTVEPHHDGTPHWHLFLWVHPEHVSKVKEIFIDYATQEDKHELMKSGSFNADPRCKIVEEDAEKGTAMGYIIKYIAKNIDGYAIGDEQSDESESTIKSLVKNVTAWKSRWNIRQFQFFGGAPVTTYRELRRFASQNKKAFMEYIFMQDRAALVDMYGLLHYQFIGPIKPARLLSNHELMEAIGNSYESRIDSKHTSVSGAMKAADHGNWMGYIMAQGGPFVKRDDLLIRNEYKTLPHASPHGEDVKKIEGFTALGESWKTRLKEWAIVSKASLEKLKKTEQDTAQGSCSSALALKNSSSAAPWSSVNNCTISVDPQSVREAVKQILGSDSLDEMTFEALCKGHSVHIGGSQYIKLRNPKVSAELVTYDDDKAERQALLDELGWLDEPKQPDDDPEPPPNNPDDDIWWPDYIQPNLSRYPELTSGEDEWPLV